MNRLLSKKWTPFVLLAVATFLVWGQTVRFGFVWDDEFFIRDLPSIRSLRHVPEMFYSLEVQAVQPHEFLIFRPVRNVHYALLYFLCGKDTPQPWIYHLANVLWHGAVAMMLFAVLMRLLPRLGRGLSEEESRNWALWIALAFAVHPVVSEVVCWAKSLDDMLAAFFTLAALRELLRSPVNTSAICRSLLFFAVAVYSKEYAVPFAVLPLVIFRKTHRFSWKQSALRTSAFCAVAAFYIAHRHLVIGRSSQVAPLSGGYGQTLLDMTTVVPKYFRLLLGIPPFFVDYSYLQGGHWFLSREVLGGSALLAALIMAGVLAWRWPGTQLAGFGLLWTGLFLLPVSNLLPLAAYMAERFLYLPLIGWLIALAAVAAVLPRRRIIHFCACSLVCLWAITAWNRSWIWRDAVTLFVRSSQEGPKTPRVERNAVAAILHLPHVQKFLIYDETTGKLGVRGAMDPALASNVLDTLEEAYRLFPEHPVVLASYGIALAATGQAARALPFLEKAARLQPENLDYQLNLARAELAAGQLAPAQTTLDKAAALAPNAPAVLQLRFTCYWQATNFTAAYDAISRLNRIAPDQTNAYWLSETEKKLKPGP